jgi:hypothetical protein
VSIIRDFDLIRKILLEVQASPAGVRPFSVEFPDKYDQAVVNEHVELLIEAGLIKGKLIKGRSGVVGMAIHALTWEGHDFIQAAEKDAIWKKSLEIVKDKGGAITFDLLKELLKSVAKSALGLP